MCRIVVGQRRSGWLGQRVYAESAVTHSVDEDGDPHNKKEKQHFFRSVESKLYEMNAQVKPYCCVWSRNCWLMLCCKVQNNREQMYRYQWL